MEEFLAELGFGNLKASPPHCLETLGFVLRPALEGSAFGSRGALLASLQATIATACQSGPRGRSLRSKFQFVDLGTWSPGSPPSCAARVF